MSDPANNPTAERPDDAAADEETAAAAQEGAARELTPEEQMAKFEEALKESDWGHQPC